MKITAMQVLIPHGITPTGFGLLAYSRPGGETAGDGWYFRPSSPCCGAFMETDSATSCVNCHTSYQAFADASQGTIGNDVPFVQDYFDPITYERWIARIMDFPNAEGKHGVKVEVQWT